MLANVDAKVLMCVGGLALVQNLALSCSPRNRNSNHSFNEKKRFKLGLIPPEVVEKSHDNETIMCFFLTA